MDIYNQNYVELSHADDTVRAGFIRKTYSHVAIAILGFFLVEAILLNIPGIMSVAVGMVSSGFTWLAILAGFMFVTSYAENMAMKSHDRSKQYMALGIYVLAEAIIFLPIIAFAMISGSGPALLTQAAVVTLTLFAGLSAVVLISGKDFSFLRSGLTVGFFIAIGLIVIAVLFGINLGFWFSAAMVILAAGSILYQTSNLVHKYSTDQYVAASLGLFASLMLMFWYILRIGMSMMGDD